LTQHPAFEYQIKITPLEEMSEEQLAESEIAYKKEVTLFKQSDYLGQKKTINLTYDRNMFV